MNVVYVSSLAEGGPVSHLRYLAPAVAKAGADVRVVCGTEDIARAFRERGLVAAAVPLRRRLDVHGARELLQHLHGADVVHTHDRRAGLVARLAGRACGARVVHTYHGLPEEIAGRVGPAGPAPTADASSLRLAWLVHGYLRVEALLARLGLVVAPSRAMASFLAAHGLPRGRIRVIPSGIDMRPAAERAAASGRFTVGVAARLEHWKGVDVLVDACGALEGRVRLEVFGDGSCRGALEERAAVRRVDAVFHGAVPDARERFPELDALVVPSRAENFPMVLLEAMAAGVPVVATRVGGIAEIVEDGRTGLLVEPDDAAGLARAIGLLHEDAERRRSLAAAARRSVLRFESSRVARQLLELYHALTEPRR